MNYAKYNIDGCDISIRSKKNKIVIMVINNNDTYSVKLDKCDDSSSFTNSDNDIGLELKTEIYNFLVNCLERKPYYNIKLDLIKSNKQYEDDKDQINLIFSFKYEMFDFEYTIELSAI